MIGPFINTLILLLMTLPMYWGFQLLLELSKSSESDPIWKLIGAAAYTLLVWRFLRLTWNFLNNRENLPSRKLGPNIIRSSATADKPISREVKTATKRSRIYELIRTNISTEFNYAYLFVIIIFIIRALIAYLESNGLPASAPISNTFAASFVEWFGILYAILASLILIRVWEQLDNIDQEFDREAGSVRIFYEDLYSLRIGNNKAGGDIAGLLREYIRHVQRKYQYEIKQPNEVQEVGNLIPKKNTRRFEALISEGKAVENARRVGDEILLKIRKQFTVMIGSDPTATKTSEVLISDLFQRLNEIIDIRGRRITFASLRLFQTLRLVAFIASILFLIPFYIVGFSDQTSIVDNILILGVTLLVVFINMIIEDFDDPFGGTWKIDDESWYLIRHEIVCEERRRRLEERKMKITLPHLQDVVAITEPAPGHRTDVKKPDIKKVITSKRSSASSKQKLSKRSNR